MQVQNIDSMSFAGRNHNLAFEPKIVGAAFNPANKGKIVEPIAGQAGVYVLQVRNTFTVPVPAADINQQRQFMEMQSKQMFRSPIETLQKAADIKDYRAKFY
jgi:peptidyl-prolyl cis-trans isomerase D